MILTKDEVYQQLREAAVGTSMLDYDAINKKLIDILEWQDDLPRDVRYEDIMLLEDWIANEMDTFLTRIELKVKKD